MVSLFFPRQGTSILQNFVSCEISQSFLRHETFHLKLIQKHLVLFSRDFPLLSFNFPVVCLLWQEPCRPREPEYLSTICSALLCTLAPTCSSSSIWVAFRASHSPSISCTRSEFHPAFPFFLPNRDLLDVAFSIFPKSSYKYIGPVHFPGIFMYLLPVPHLIHRYFSASAHHSVRCFVSSLSLSTKINFLLALASTLHNPFIPPLSSASWPRTARPRKLPLLLVGLSLLSLPP